MSNNLELLKSTIDLDLDRSTIHGLAMAALSSGSVNLPKWIFDNATMVVALAGNRVEVIDWLWNKCVISAHTKGTEMACCSRIQQRAAGTRVYDRVLL